MKSLMILVMFMVSSVAQAAGGGFGGEQFMIQKCYAFGASGAGSFDNPAAGVDGDISRIPLNSVVDRVDVLVHTALAGTTDVLVGDDDDNDGYVAAANVTEATPAMYSGEGAYVSAGAKKYYSASSKELKLDVVGTLSAGKYCVMAFGYRLR